MAFWRFSFHSQSGIKSILSASSADNNGHPTDGFSTPSSSNPSILLDKLLEEDDLLQEIKAQNPKLIEFLGTKPVLLRILGYISGLIFDDEEADRLEEEDRSAINHLSPPLPSPSTEHHPSSMGGAILNSIRTRAVSDKISALLMDALDSEGRTPEDRAKAERRKVRFPYLCSEIIASDIWKVTSEIFSDAPQYAILTRFWDAILNQPPSVTAQKSIQIGHWARTNIALFNFKPNEMIAFVKSYPGVIPKLLSHFNSSPVVDVLMRIVQCEATIDGVIDWLIDDTDMVELIISFLHPSRPPELHLAVADFIKSVISFCTTTAAPNQSNNTLPLKSTSPVLSQQPPQLSLAGPSPHSPNSPSDKPPGGPGFQDEHPKLLTTRLMREFSSTAVVSKLLAFGLDAKIAEDESLITTESITSSLVNSLSILIDLIRRNNSDYSEHQIMIHLRELNYKSLNTHHQSGSSLSPPSETSTCPVSSSRAPAIVPLMDLLDAVSSRFPDLQRHILSPHSSTRPIRTTVGTVVPLTLERFRIVELYAELLHCSNMAMVNRPNSKGPVYDEHGHLISGLEELIAVFSPIDADSPTALTRSSTVVPEPDSSTVILEDLPSANLAIPHNILEDPAAASAEVVQIVAGYKDSEPELVTDVMISSQGLNNLSAEAGDQDSAGMRLKRRFITNKILDTCLDLFFDYPWNNFLHNVVYDIVQQTFNGKFSGPGSEANVELARSVFESSHIVERILEGVEINRTYGSISNNIRLGNMAHVVLIADETAKVLDSNLEAFAQINQRLSSHTEWQTFVNTAVQEARVHSSTPLGGGIPLGATSLASPSHNKALLIDGETFPSSSASGQNASKLAWSIQSSGAAGSSGDNQPKGDDHARYLVEHIRANVANQFSSSSDEDDENEDEHIGREEDLDDPWATGRRSTSASGRSSVISNPTPFGFDDRFDAPSRSFPSRFAHRAEEDEDGDEDVGFGDDFGPFSDASAIHQVPIYDPFTLTTGGSSSRSSKSKVPPEVPPRKPPPINWQTGSRPHDLAGEGEGADDDDEEWGAFSSARAGEGSRVEETKQDGWTDFDLAVTEPADWKMGRSRAGSASSADEPFGPGVTASKVQAIREDGRVEVRLDDGSLVTVPSDEVMSAVVSSSEVAESNH